MSYKIIETEGYKKKLLRFLRAHPDLIKRYAKTIKLLEENPFHPSLRLHKLQGKKADYHSVSVTVSYRMVIEFLIEDEAIIPIDIGSHDEVYG